MTSTIGIPIKLLNEAAVSDPCGQESFCFTDVDTGPCRYPRTLNWPSLPWKACRRCAEPETVKRDNALIQSIAEDNMNVQLSNVNVTNRDGKVMHLDQVYIRGSHVRFFIVPDMLR